MIGPQLLALLRKWTGGYERPLYVFAGMFVIALVVAIVLAMQVRELREKAHGETTPEEDTLAGEPAIETAG